jgi:hypothetical protein
MDRSVKTIFAVPAIGVQLCFDTLAFSVWAFLIVKRSKDAFDFVNRQCVCHVVSLFDAAILTGFELSTKSFLKIFFLVSRQSSRNPQFGIVKAVFARQLFFSSVVKISSTYRQPLVNRQSSIVNRQQLVNLAKDPFVLCCV